MKSIVLFGAGNVATHLFSVLSKAKNFQVIQVYNHQKKALEKFDGVTPTTTDFKEVFPADIYLLAVKDEAIPILAEKLVYKDALMLHTSGATPISVFDNYKKKGILYPLQTFSKTKPIDFRTVPLCIEAGSEDEQESLEELAGELSDKIYSISSEQRKSLHLAAVFVNNFTNFMYLQGEKICKDNNLPFEILKPLILETAAKGTSMAPAEAQTGPARRNDTGIINSHLSLLGGKQKDIYQLLTDSIREFHGEKL